MEEIVDVVDGEDVKIGTTTRREVHSSGAWHRGAHVLVFNSRGELILQRRSAKKGKSPRALDLSVSEHVKTGESYDEAAVRGLKEELGIEGLPLERVLKFRMVYVPGDNMISILYRARFAGRFKLDPSEVEEVITASSRQMRSFAEEQGEKLAPWARQLLRWYLGLPSKVEEVAE